jgi:methionyl-tRNA formyltransferase
MRVLFFGNNWMGWRIALWLRAQGEEIVGLVLHEPERRGFGEEILRAAETAPEHIFDASTLQDPCVVERLRDLRPEIGVSALFGYVLRREVLDLPPSGCVNVHPALLPYNAGAYPNVWPIVDRTPAGVTIHFMDEGVDTGDIIAQRRVEIEPADTGETLYQRLLQQGLELFCETWPAIRSGHPPRIPQNRAGGTVHRVADVARIDEIKLDRMYTARQLIDILRARTFPPHPGAYFREGSRKIYLRLQLLSEDPS